jgi:hypothetical protein
VKYAKDARISRLFRGKLDCRERTAFLEPFRAAKIRLKSRSVMAIYRQEPA